MESKYLRIGFIVTIIFILSMIYTTSQLFSLQDELILGVDSLSTDNISELSTVLNSLYITVALSLILGLVSILLNFKVDEGIASQQAFFSKQKSATDDQKAKTVNTEEAAKSTTTIDLSALRKATSSAIDKKDKYQAVLAEICKELEAGQGAIYLTKESKDIKKAELYVSYAFHVASGKELSFDFGEGLIGQVAVEGKPINIDEIPDNYINIVSGLGSSSPKHLFITPLLQNKKVIGVAEIASFRPVTKDEGAWVNEGLSLLSASPVKKSGVAKKSGADSKKEKVDKK